MNTVASTPRSCRQEPWPAALGRSAPPPGGACRPACHASLPPNPERGEAGPPILRAARPRWARKAAAWAAALLVLASLALPGRLLADDRCAICGRAPAGGSVFFDEDKVTHQKVEVCEDCEKNFPACFVCGLPANTNLSGFVSLADGRALCARDAKTAVLREEDGVRIFREVRDSLDRMFARFTAFPDTNITVAMVDRVHLQELFTLAGNDYHCPNIFGYTHSKTNRHRLEHRISLMTGLPLTWLQAVCAHELTHAWVAENVAPARRRALAREAEEGFCELLAYLYADSRNDPQEKEMILQNGYTRGQVDLFVAAARDYGFNDLLDWMRYGTDNRLSASDPGRVHQLSATRPAAQGLSRWPGFRTAPAAPATNLVLRAVFWDQARPLAIINDHTFAVRDEASVRVGASNVVVRCLAIRPDAVRIQVRGHPAAEELLLPAGLLGK